jgi:hypothetical protein
VGKTSLRASAVAAATLLALTTSFAVASAHFIFAAGKYRIAIGWQNEPSSGTDTYVGEQNAIQVFIDIAPAGDPHGTAVSTLNQDCSHPDFQVTVTVGSTTSSPLCPASVYDADTSRGRLDEYDYALIPTVVGAYTFRIFGTINGTRVDQKITSGPTTFDSVADANAVEFPVAVPGVAQVATKVDTVSQRASSALTSAQTAAANAADARNSASGATVLAIVALVAAVLLGAANLVVGLRRRRT